MQIDFLISSERSGSNLVSKLLDGHSNYCSPTPPHLGRVFVPILGSYGDLTSNANWSMLVKDVKVFFDLKIGNPDLDSKKHQIEHKCFVAWYDVTIKIKNKAYILNTHT